MLIVVFFIVISSSSARMVFEQQKPVLTNDFDVSYTVLFSDDDFIFETSEGFDTVALTDGGYTSEVGKPMLPMKQIRLALPTGMKAVKVHITGSQQEILDDTYSIFPMQQPRRLIALEEDVSFIDPDEDVYSSDQPYPSSLVELMGQSDLAGQSWAVIAVYPLHYRP